MSGAQRAIGVIRDSLMLFGGAFGSPFDAVVRGRIAALRPGDCPREGAACLPHLFGPGGFTVLRKPEELPRRLPILYAQLTGR